MQPDAINGPKPDNDVMVNAINILRDGRHLLARQGKPTGAFK